MRPNGKDAVIKTLKKHVPHDYLINSVTLLSTGERLGFERDGNALTIRATDAFNSDKPLCFKIDID